MTVPISAEISIQLTPANPGDPQQQGDGQLGIANLTGAVLHGLVLSIAWDLNPDQ